MANGRNFGNDSILRLNVRTERHDRGQSTELYFHHPCCYDAKIKPMLHTLRCVNTMLKARQDCGSGIAYARG